MNTAIFTLCQDILSILEDASPAEREFMERLLEEEVGYCRDLLRFYNKEATHDMRYHIDRFMGMPAMAPMKEVFESMRHVEKLRCLNAEAATGTVYEVVVK